MACAIIERTSSDMYEPSSEIIAPRHLKLVAILNARLLTWISHRMPLALCVISLVFSAFISIVYLVHVLSRHSLKAFIPCSSSAKALIASANCRSVSVLLPMLTFLSGSSRASDKIFPDKMLKKVGVRRYPCLSAPPVSSWGGRVVRWSWVNFHCRGVLQFG